jgi:hypothetical protein
MISTIEMPAHLKKFDFKKYSEHPTCNEAEGNYRTLLSKGVFNSQGVLRGFSGLEIGRVVIGSIYDPAHLSGLHGQNVIAIVKNPLGQKSIHEKERIGWQNALIDTDEWMFLAAVDADRLRITRPINFGETVMYLRKLKAEALRKVDWEAIRQFPPTRD